MKVSDIIYQVRESLDEQSGTTDYADGYLDNIIKAKVYDALRWVLMYSDVSLLSGGSSADSSNGGVVEKKYTVADGLITLGSDFVRLVRVRCSGWSKAVMNAIEEDSEEYLMQSDSTAQADKTRPVVALIRSVPNKLEVFPHCSESVNVTYVSIPELTSAGTLTGDSPINIPSKLITAYIYYICYLVMIAYDNQSKAQSMLNTAKMSLGSKVVES